MRDLKSLQQEFPVLDDDFLGFCASHGIYSLEDFLLHDLYALVGFTECQASSAKLKQGITQVLSIIDSQHQPWSNGIELLKDHQNKHVLSTGLAGMDSLLEGGLCEGKFIELAGSSSSGKTQVCLAAAAHIAHKYMCTVMFLDTCCSFSSKRIACHEKERCFTRVMKSILCRPVFDILELSEVLHQIEITLASQVESQHTKMRLLIIDSVSSLIAPILGRNSTGHSAMVSIGYLLKRLAIEYNVAVLVTNHMVGGEGGILKPALGESWKRLPHIRLLLSREPDNNICTVSILKHTSVALGRTTTFVLPKG
ncbi:unnamed protein product [Victoria cruziana]